MLRPNLSDLVKYLTIFLLCLIEVRCVDDGGVVEGCAENEVAFGCKRDGTAIAIKEAWLHDSWIRMPHDECHIPEYNVQFKKGSVLSHMNKICSMRKACRFNTWRDIPGAKDDEKRWIGSVIRVIYECITVSSIFEECGKRIESQYGWVQNNGYPSYYLGPAGACTTTLVVDPGQRIQLEIIDLSLREINRPADTECTDYLSVDEGSKQLFSMCGVSNEPIKFTSYKNVLNVTLHTGTSLEMYPKRGFLATFRALGCQTPKIPVDGYLSHRDDKNAEFWCCVRHVFPDTMSRIRKITCNDRVQWSDEVPDCVDLDDLLIAGNITEDEYKRYNGSITASMLIMNQDLVFDIIIPGVIMVSLIIGNVGVLLLIIFCRRRAKEENQNLEELESIKANEEATDVRDSQPCEV